MRRAFQGGKQHAKRKVEVRDLRRQVDDLWIDLLLDLAPELEEACSKFPNPVRCPVHPNCDGFMFHEDVELTGGARCKSAGFGDGIKLLTSLKGWGVGETCRQIEAWLESKGRGLGRESDGGLSSHLHDAPRLDPVAELNQQHFVVSIGGRTYIATETVNGDTGHLAMELGGVHDFTLRYSNRQVEEGEKKVPLAQLWLSSPDRREYAGVVFSPGGEVEGRYNLWTGFSVEPVQGDCSLFWEHVRHVLCREQGEHYTYVRKWMAHMVQCPDELPEVAIVIRGSQGTGKTFFADALGALLGPHYSVLNRVDQVTGRFTGHLKTALLVYVNEAIWGGDKQCEGALKTMITDRWYSIESKGKDPYPVRNLKRVIFSSNEEWAVPMGMDDRRFLVLESSDAHKGDTVYFAELHRQMENGGLQALLYDLLNEDLTGFDVRSKPSSTHGFDMKLRSSDPVVRWWYEKLFEGTLAATAGALDFPAEWDQMPNKDALHKNFLAYCEVHRLKTIGKPLFGKWLRKLLPGCNVGETRPVPVHDDRPRYHMLPTLEECREAFQRYAKSGPEIWT